MTTFSFAFIYSYHDVLFSIDSFILSLNHDIRQNADEITMDGWLDYIQQ